MFGCLVRDADLTVTIIIYAEHKTTDSAAAEMKLRFSFYYIIKNFIKKQKQKKHPPNVGYMVHPLTRLS